MIIKTYAYPRAALIGNPSDGYFGKTMAFTFSNFQADITLYASKDLEILHSRRDKSKFGDKNELLAEIRAFGYYGGIRIIKAALKRFFDYCEERRIDKRDGNFTIRYHTSIPPHLGLAGSSAIITACMRALMSYYSVSIPLEELANVVLSVEREELGISAGLQDRVAQAYQALVFMDFDQHYMEEHGHGKYEVLRDYKLPRLYIAYRDDLSEGSEITHNNLRYRWEQGDREVREAMGQWAQLTEEFRSAIEAGDRTAAATCINRNFDLRKRICTISPANQKLVDLARSTGASAKFTGSGGAIIGTYQDEEMFSRLIRTCEAERIKVIKPEVCHG